MRKSIFVKLFIASMTCLSFVSLCGGQELVREISLKQQVQNSLLVVEGKVIFKESFLDEDNNVYTINKVEVYKAFKGQRLPYVNVVTKGGSVGSRIQLVTHSLKLELGDLGVFNLEKSGRYSINGGLLSDVFRVYSGSQGFYKYNLYDDLVVNLVGFKKGISEVFYKELMDITQKKYFDVMTFSVKGEASRFRQLKGSLVPTSITFSPTLVSAGTKETITITVPDGATGNFGSEQGKVSFRNADSGGVDNGLSDYIDALDTQVINWSTNSITVEVPSNAGTGNIRVVDASQNVIDSSTNLEISYAELNVNATFTIGGETKTYAYPTRMVDNDGSGGYVLQMEESFDAESEHPGSKADFMKALDTWRCETGLNFSFGEVTSVDEAVFDGINVIRFDNAGELEDGVLGQTTYSFQGCGTSLNNYEVFVEEIDMVFDDGETWYFGNGLPGFEIDFQSVALHEIGHAHQLGHVIDDNDDVMHYSIGFGEQLRVLSLENVLAATNVQDRSQSGVPSVSCFSGKASMSAFDCQLSVEEEELVDVISIYPNPTNGIFYIKNRSSINLEKVFINDVSGRVILGKDITNESIITINLKGVSKGMYLINLLSDSGIISSKLLID
ncbi:T9SS type A sorting domain-containing protein [uncultured Algibacter sp.]|uniref:T9SS type A sorting domain-containing protein n=1 Tax=uncultured Algibacter sp. TaxID=298659 RepID=UPI002639A6DB|nr:T9SS type A sorting domain-containing protein [uncultured Algibacter sp.]